MNNATDIANAVLYLKSKGIEAFEGSGILVVPASSPEEIYDLVHKVKRYFKECGYEKSWLIDPYYYQKHDVKGDDYEQFNEE